MLDVKGAQMLDHPGEIATVRESIVYANPYLTVHDDDVLFPDGSAGTYARVRSGDGNPGVVVVPWSGAALGLVKVYRYPIGAWQWGFPRGFAHGPDPLATAAEELREELGLAAGLSMVGWFTPDSGLLDSRVAVVLARTDSTDGTPEDTQEVAEVQWMEPQDLWSRLGQPPYDDGMTMAALALATRLLDS